MSLFYRRKKRRKKKPRYRAPEFTVSQILAWADAWYRCSGTWPKKDCGSIPGSLGETWMKVDGALRRGDRGLPGGSSLARLLAAERGVRNHMALPPFTIRQVLAWCDGHHRRTGRWPKGDDGPIPEAPGETWAAVEAAFRQGTRGLAGGWSLAQLLADKRGVRNDKRLPPFSVDQILAWADAHRQRTGSWPTQYTGRVHEAPGETWMAVEKALYHGRRGLPGGSSLAQLLTERRGVRNIQRLPPFRLTQLVAWARAHRQRSGQWPNRYSGPIVEAPGETWRAVDTALCKGGRGLPGGSSLALLLAERCGKIHLHQLPPLDPDQVAAWARAHHQRTGAWPKQTSGRIVATANENWKTVDNALRRGHRGLPGGSSLAELLAERFAVRNPKRLPPLRYKQILAWARAHHQRHGKWPNEHSGPIAEAPGESWQNVDAALRRGLRGLAGGSSLHRLFHGR